MPRGRLIPGYQRKDKSWAGATAGTLDLVANGTTLLGGSIFADEAVTAMRTLTEYIIYPTTAPVIGDKVIIHVGIGVFSTDAVAAGSGSLPDPGAEPDYPWMYWASHPFGFSGTDPDTGTPNAAVRATIDIRAMRKMNKRQSTQFVVEYQDVSGAPPMSLLIGATRCLFAE